MAMASVLSQFRSLLLRPAVAVSNLRVPPVQPVRHKSKKSGGTVRNKIGATRPKYRGLKASDGAFVHQSDVLLTQFGLKYYPGENVLMDHKLTLHAALDGVMVITTETLNPYPDSPLYEPIQKGHVVQKKFLNVIPTALQGKFRLVSET